MGDLPLLRLPVRIAVVGSPLVLSKQRVGMGTGILLEELTHVTLQQQWQRQQWEQPEGCMQHTATPSAAVQLAHQDQECPERRVTNTAYNTTATITVKSSSNSTRQPQLQHSNVCGPSICTLDLGEVPVGVQHKCWLYVSNTGARRVYMCVIVLPSR